MSNIQPITLRDGKPAIDVKDHHLYARDPIFTRFYDELGENDMNAVFEEVQENFWELYAPEISRKFGYGPVYSDGRSGGWLIVTNPPTLEKGTEEISSAQIRENAETWNRFEDAIDELVIGCRAEIASRLAQVIDERNSEATEAHEMACRDIVTVA